MVNLKTYRKRTNNYNQNEPHHKQLLGPFSDKLLGVEITLVSSNLTLISSVVHKHMEVLRSAGRTTIHQRIKTGPNESENTSGYTGREIDRRIRKTIVHESKKSFVPSYTNITPYIVTNANTKAEVVMNIRP